MIIHNFGQRTEEWKDIRVGKFTGSDFHTFLGNSETKKRMLLEKTVERLVGRTKNSNITNDDIERGVRLEDIARTNYEMETGNSVQMVGFIEKDDWVGCSPDGLVGDDGIIEIKCPKSSIFLKHLLDDRIEPQYYTQIQFNLFVSERKWCDFVRYNEYFPLYVKRVEADKEYQEKIANTLDECIKEIKQNLQKAKERGVQCLHM